MHRRHPFAAFSVAVALLLLCSQGAYAEFAYANQVAGSAIYDGLSGNMGIRTDPATVVGIGYVHIAQADVGPNGGDFVAIGTANGVGVDSCADSYNANWTGYYDGELGGVYFCDDFSINAFAAGSNPSFQILYTFCPAVGLNRWVLTMSGVQRSCIAPSSTGATRVLVGLETTGGSTIDRNIDVKYTVLKKNLTGSLTWSDFGNVGAAHFENANYSYQLVSNTALNTYLAPLN